MNQIPEKFLKHLSGHKDLYEIRVSYGGSIYQEDPPPSSHFLRWKVSTKRESKTLEVRNCNVG